MSGDPTTTTTRSTAPGQVWRHYKGMAYRIVADWVQDATNGPLNQGGISVVYEELASDDSAVRTWRRPREEFLGATVDKNGKPVFRFEPI